MLIINIFMIISLKYIKILISVVKFLAIHICLTSLSLIFLLSVPYRVFYCKYL